MPPGLEHFWELEGGGLPLPGVTALLERGWGSWEGSVDLSSVLVVSPRAQWGEGVS